MVRKILCGVVLALSSLVASAQYEIGSRSFAVASSGAAAAPTFSPVAGAVSNPTTVTASTATSGCGSYIYFDTSNPPTTNTTTYSVTTAVTLYSYVHGCPGHADSSVSSASYTIGSSGYSYVSGSYAMGANTGATASTSYTCSGGELLVIPVANDNPANSSFAVTVNGTAATAASSLGSAGGPDYVVWQLFYFTHCPAGTATVVATTSGDNTTVVVKAFTGGTQILDNAGTPVDTDTSPVSCSATASTAGELTEFFVYARGNYGTWSALTSGFTARSSLSSDRWLDADDVSSSSGTVAPSVAFTNTPMACIAATFK